jgi:hypothetical protein
MVTPVVFVVGCCLGDLVGVHGQLRTCRIRQVVFWYRTQEFSAKTSSLPCDCFRTSNAQDGLT